MQKVIPFLINITSRIVLFFSTSAKALSWGNGGSEVEGVEEEVEEQSSIK